MSSWLFYVRQKTKLSQCHINGQKLAGKNVKRMGFSYFGRKHEKIGNLELLIPISTRLFPAELSVNITWPDKF